MTTLPAKISSYDPAAVFDDSKLPKQNTLNAIKAFIDTNALLVDASIYPTTTAVGPLCAVALMPWLQKAVTAREAAIVFYAESGTVLE